MNGGETEGVPWFIKIDGLTADYESRASGSVNVHNVEAEDLTCPALGHRHIYAILEMLSDVRINARSRDRVISRGLGVFPLSTLRRL
jgi:hypothetical protein